MEAWPETQFAQRLRDMPRSYDTLRTLRDSLSPFLPGSSVNLSPSFSFLYGFEMIGLYTAAGEMITYLIPLLMMRQQRIPRSKWVMHQTERGKKWIEKVLCPFHILFTLLRLLIKIQFTYLPASRFPFIPLFLYNAGWR